MARQRILLVENDAVIAAQLQGTLSELGYDVAAIATSDDEALRLADSIPFDLLLLDILLDGPPTGSNVAQPIARRHEVPVVFLGASSDEAFLGKASALPACGYVRKPVQAWELRLALELALTRHVRDQQARESEERARILSEVGGCFAFSLLVGPEGRPELAWVTEAYQELVGYGLDECEAMGGWRNIIHPEDFTRATQSLQGMRPGETPPPLRLRLLTKDRGVRWLNVRLRPVWDDTQETPVRIHGAGVDVTEDVQAEEVRRGLELRVQQAQKMESMGVLAGGLAHEFNNLLTIIIGNSDLLLRGLPQASPHREGVHQIFSASHRAAELTRQMLAFSGKGRALLERVNLASEVEGLVGHLQASVPTNAVFRFQHGEGLPVIRGDPAQIRQVIVNLVANASEAVAPGGGTITIRTGSMDCDKEYLSRMYFDDDLPAGPYAFVEVADTGAGMSESTRQRIFDPFFTTKLAGRGLGLPAVLGIVRGHRGAIKVYSEVGRGTVVRVLLPAAEETMSTSKTPKDDADETAGLWSGSGLVLVADDEPAVRSLAMRILESVGFEVVSASNGKEAVALFAAYAPRLRGVLLDLTMPFMGGEEALHEMRRIRPDVPVILTSGYNEQDVSAHFADQGLAGFLQKPYVLEEFIRVVRGALC